MNEDSQKNSNQQNALIERHRKILEILKQNGTVSVSSLTETLGVSEVTVRKDLTILEQRKKLHRTHGGAIMVSPFISDRHVSEKEKQNVDEKLAIGIAANSLITTNDSILIASGTTVLFFANEIEPKGHLTVVTASVGVTSVLSQRKDVDVIQLGGIVRFSSLSVVGPFAEQMLDNFNCSKLFLGVDGIDMKYGLTTTNALEASLNKVMINCSQKLIVLADSSKFGRKGFSKICNLEAVDEIITDDKISSHTVQELEEHGIKVTVVSA
ncbi:MAG: DeoR/GlpR family DNA-binding transcription regulator [Bacteroidales bacterium]|jgi:DeoR family transcriptional regulator of aga operon|nr:DeoR/GlpR family DNA-binding transcription regulator [Bacteroidales bacterium]MCI2122253.1 DeoR/GlpR family DNA-binding transcription regulator [Bacteroidales bacterium]MCI2145299.1 DeoR/GlpR family DNA-binding transcription regulator [Bacteroidales bacterium]